jgi:predicted ATPase
VLTQLELRQFKCFELQRVPLAPLTLLAGTNASGKSSVLQALVLLHQTMHEHEWSTRLMLNGDTINLGTVADVVDKEFGRFSFEIRLDASDTTFRSWLFSGDRSELSMAVQRVNANGQVTDNPVALRYLTPPNSEISAEATNIEKTITGLTYITAERLGPREVYPLKDKQIATVVGATGQYAMSVLHWGRDLPVLAPLVTAGVPNKLIFQVEATMRTFFPGCRIDLQQVVKSNAVTLGIATTETGDFHRPIHVGFGLTQVLPIVIAALSASMGDILLIENPEVHLHPAGQAMMGRFLATVAAAGVQVIAESHSDHVLNGIRRAVKSCHIQADQVALHFFRPRAPRLDQVVSPGLDANGNIDDWPDGFFDQFDKDVNYFAGWAE